MQRFRTICLGLVLTCFLPQIVIAGAVTNEEPDMAEIETKDFSLRIRPDVDGFHLLDVAGIKIEATYLEEILGERHGAIIFFHDRGAQLESQGVITPLRHKMIEYGWSTLTISLDYPEESAILLSGEPDLEPIAEEQTAEMDAEENKNTEALEVLPPISNQQRLDAAVAFLQEKDVKRILFLGHGAGGHVAIDVLSNITDSISALILVGVPGLSLRLENAFSPMRQPVFDIYGDNEIDDVVAAVKRRKLMMKRMGSEQYLAREVLGADHVFYGLEESLVKTLRGWLNTTFVEPDKQK
ncbi:MAG: DUF3530 family protein [Piscirickettsiaceae bacterium]|nr:DUF3530 family protein [Piscirickettsiaceae bacterium]